ASHCPVRLRRRTQHAGRVDEGALESARRVRQPRPRTRPGEREPGDHMVQPILPRGGRIVPVRRGGGVRPTPGTGPSAGVGTYRILLGDCRDTLRTLPDASVHCVVTSPPYYGLRDYGTETWEGGDPECSHQPKAAPRSSRPASGLTGGKATVDAGSILRARCHCGAVRQDRQLGLEATPEEYVANMVDVFREVRRVLRRDGTLWLNLGDTYNAYNGNRGAESRYAGDRRKIGER